MENTLTYGYTSEKIYTGLLANTIPVYFGNKEIEKIINLDRIVYCRIPDEKVVSLRNEWRSARKEMQVRLGVDQRSNPDDNGTLQILMDPLVKKWAVNSYGPYLQKCIDEVIEIDQNDTLYKWKLAQDIVPNNSFANSHYDGTVVTDSLLDIMRYLQSPLFD